MRYVNLGNTGLRVSRLCLGMMSYGAHPERPWALPEADAEPIIRRAVEAGITFFDTADVYNGGESEVVTGGLASEIPIQPLPPSSYRPSASARSAFAYAAPAGPGSDWMGRLRADLGRARDDSGEQHRSEQSSSLGPHTFLRVDAHVSYSRSCCAHPTQRAACEGRQPFPDAGPSASPLRTRVAQNRNFNPSWLMRPGLGRSDHAEPRRGHVRVGRVELRVVERVERLEPELQPHAPSAARSS